MQLACLCAFVCVTAEAGRHRQARRQSVEAQAGNVCVERLRQLRSHREAQTDNEREREVQPGRQILTARQTHTGR